MKICKDLSLGDKPVLRTSFYLCPKVALQKSLSVTFQHNSVFPTVPHPDGQHGR